MVQLIEAMATDRARRVNTKYGERTVIDAVRRDNGEKVTVWRGGDDEYSQKYVIKNARLTLTLDNKGKYNLVEDPALVNLGQPLPESPVPVKPVSRHLASNNPPIPTYPIPDCDPNFSPDRKAEMAEYIANLAQLYQHCQDKAEDLALTPDDARAIATTFFIQTVKKFAI
ncbi:MAG: hypothetical protein IM550_06550 [Microcystis sp. M54BS1]|uniref:hypothetical protein n=1 Tax=unclassified Microcystis TaxID=2643300 RepID=UPI0025799B2F|nr:MULTISPECIES: hypothetical protein [unclassified Microcystis]MCA2538900.1 hypothetical protein [Microcystis sp. M54BS1]MCA2596544.1 hypothetical protein [Microcystis sp. M38BS1]MCA2611979.1 hypothetical protein [Microcystis sp. M27BS1]MCA2504775.1 hypothetical protein [Microcystis sp. M62BS1]MCA2511026.1 hypothetical protein [Microcystis sp. M60BS1]